MGKKLYLLSLGLLIFLAVLTVLQGTRYILSPVGLFQFASLANRLIPLLLGPLIAVFLVFRFIDVLKERSFVDQPLQRPAARVARLSGKLLIYLFYVLLLLAIVSLVLARGQLSGEVRFLFAPLFRTLPVGFLLFELANLLEGAKFDDNASPVGAGDECATSHFAAAKRTSI